MTKRKRENKGYRLCKGTYNDRQGKKRQGTKWVIEFRDHTDRPRPRRLTAFTDQRASHELGKTLVRLVALRAAGEGPDRELTERLELMPKRIREKLVEWGLLDSHRLTGSKSLSDHLDDWKAALLAKGNTAEHAGLVVGRVRRVFDCCGFRFWSDISASRVLSHLSELREDTDDRRGISAQTFNFYIQAIKQFCRWMVADGRATESPVVHLEGMNVRTDRRHDRRPLTVDEARRLLAATSGAGERYGMAGTERSLLYRVALESGLRAGELRSLMRASFALDTDPPTVTVAAAYSKHRREDVLPLRLDTVEVLRQHLKSKSPAAQVFAMPRPDDVARMLRADLADADIPYRDDAGRVADFHALRHTFITNLASSGVHPKTAQALARHSTITLTMDRYSHSYQEAESAALAALPDLGVPTDEAARATGTDGKTDDARLALHLALRGGSDDNSADSDGQSGANAADSEKAEKHGRNSVSSARNGEGGIRTRGAGNTPLNGLANRRLQPLGHLSGVYRSSLPAAVRLSIPFP